MSGIAPPTFNSLKQARDIFSSTLSDGPFEA
jgi:hypothetical protein